MPRHGLRLWNIFLRISGRRGSSGFGILPLAWADIDAFSRLTQTPLEPWEVRILEELDDAYLIERSRASRSSPPAPESETAQ